MMAHSEETKKQTATVQSSSRFQLSGLHFLQVYYFTSYYALGMGYRFRWNHDKEEFQIIEFLPQKVRGGLKIYIKYKWYKSFF